MNAEMVPPTEQDVNISPAVACEQMRGHLIAMDRLLSNTKWLTFDGRFWSEMAAKEVQQFLVTKVARIEHAERVEMERKP